MTEPINTQIDTQIPTPPQIPTPLPVVPTTKPSPLVPISLGISVLALGMAGFFGYQYFQIAKQTTKRAPAPTSSAESVKSTEKEDTTTNWKTYTDSKNFFSFGYPSDGQYNAKNHSIALSEGDLQVYSPAPMGYGYCYKYGSKKTVTLSGNKFTLITGTGVSEKTEMCDNPNPDKGSIVATIATSNDDVLIEYSYDIKNADDASKLLNQILSTFKFTNNTKLPTASEAKAKTFDYLVSTGHKRDVVKVIGCDPLGNSHDKFICSYNPSPDYNGGGMFILIGRINDEWIIPEGSGAEFCDWISKSSLDKNDKSFFGSDCPFNK